MGWLDEKKKNYAAKEEIRKAKVAGNNANFKAKMAEIDERTKLKMEELDRTHKENMLKIEEQRKAQAEEVCEYSAVIGELDRFNKEEFYSMSVAAKELKITAKKKEDVIIPYSDIISVEPFTETEIKTRNKSVLGRAVVGGALLGGAGAIVGGMTGLNKTEDKKEKRYIILTYRENDQEISRTFSISNRAWKKMVFEIEEHITK